MSVPPENMPPAPPAPSPSIPPEPPPQPPAGGNGTGTEDRNLAMLTHLSGLLFGFIVPLIVWLVSKDRSDKSYLVGEAKEALNFQITVLIGYVICWILTIIIIGVFLFWLLWLANLVFCIIAAVAVNNSGTYRYPFCLRLVS